MLREHEDFRTAGVCGALRATFLATDAELLQQLQQVGPPATLQAPEEGAPLRANYVLSSGCVACVVLVRERRLFVANLGDCRAVLFAGNTNIDLTQDHRVDEGGHEGERQRLNDLGVDVSNDGYLHGRIAVSRALGDWAWFAQEKCQGLISEPDVSEVALPDDAEFLLLGCDGIFEKMSSKEAAQIVRRSLRSTRDAKAAADALVKNAKKGKSSDNLSAVVVVFKLPEPIGGGSERSAPRRLFGAGRVTLAALAEAAPSDGADGTGSAGAEAADRPK